MKILCRHGHLAFYPEFSSEIARFSNYFDQTLKRERDYFTFEGLYGADSYSLLAKPYLNLPAIATYEGEPWEVMRENGFVYSIALGILVPKLTILAVIDLPLIGFYFRYGGPVLQPGCRTLGGQQVLSYTGQLDVDQPSSMRVLEYEYE